MRARVSEARGRWFDSSRSLQIFDIRGLGKRINPLGLGPRESRFKSEVPDQFLWGSQAVRQLAVTQFIRRFESCPHSQNAGVAFWLRAPLLQRGAVEFDPLPRHQEFRSDFARLWPSGFRHRSSKAVHAGSSPARRSMPRSFNGRTKVFEAFYVGSIPALGAKVGWRGVRCTGGFINRFAPD